MYPFTCYLARSIIKAQSAGLSTPTGAHRCLRFSSHSSPKTRHLIHHDTRCMSLSCKNILTNQSDRNNATSASNADALLHSMSPSQTSLASSSTTRNTTKMQPSASHDYFVGIKQKMVSACRLPHDALSNWPCKSSYSTAAANYERMSTQSTEHTDCSSTTSTTVPTTPEPENVTYHMRTLPDSLVSFTSHKGRQLFKEALNEGYAEGYFNLAGNFTAQSEPAYCGPSSLAMVLNALEVDPKRTWKGVWRWYSDELLESCRTESEMKANGITFDQFFCLASSHAHVVAKRGREASREEFLRDIKYVTQRDDVFMVVSFARATLDQTGDGHFSPIGAYHPESNQALVLDSARYKYPSWFCDIDRLYDALQPVDLETNLPRGYFLISRLDTQEDKAPLSFSSRNAGPAESGFDEPAVVGAVQKGGDAGTLPLSSQHPASDAALLTKISCTKGHSTCCSNQPK